MSLTDIPAIINIVRCILSLCHNSLRKTKIDVYARPLVLLLDPETHTAGVSARVLGSHNRLPTHRLSPAQFLRDRTQSDLVEEISPSPRLSASSRPDCPSLQILQPTRWAALTYADANPAVTRHLMVRSLFQFHLDRVCSRRSGRVSMRCD